MNLQHNSLISLGVYLKKYRFKLFLVFIALIVSAFSVLSIGITARYFVNYGFGLKSIHSLNVVTLVFAGILILLAAASAIRSYLINMICENVVIDITRDAYNTLINTSVSHYNTNNVTDIVSRIVNDTQLIQNVISSIFSFFIRNVVMMIGGIILLFITNALLTTYVMISIPLVIAPIILFAKKVRVTSKEAQSKLSSVASHIEETLSGIKTVQANNAENYEINNFFALTKIYIESALNRSMNRSVLVAIVMAVVSISTLIVLWVGGKDVLDGKMSGGDLASFIFYSIVVASSIGGMSEVIGDINRASGAAERIMDLFSLTQECKTSNKTLAKNLLSIDFENVSFSYSGREEAKVLKNLSFSIKKGETVAIVGKSGSGKTTIVNLLLKFYRPSTGEIKINHINIDMISTSDIRSSIGVVSQETFIFSNTAYYNIAYAMDGISEKEVIKAAKAANIHDFILSLPNGYNTNLGEKGAQLSGGQKQRISIARTILRNPSILILDEATSNLDEHNASIVQESLNNLRKGRTALIISHREKSLEHCDRVISIDS